MEQIEAFSGGARVAARRLAVGGWEDRALTQQEISRVLGGFATIEGIAHGFRSGLRFLCLMMLAIGSTVAILLTRAGKGLRAQPGSGFLRFIPCGPAAPAPQIRAENSPIIHDVRGFFCDSISRITPLARLQDRETARTA